MDKDCVNFGWERQTAFSPTRIVRSIKRPLKMTAAKDGRKRDNSGAEPNTGAERDNGGRRRDARRQIGAN
ncbi:hypothetical protein L195_g015033 [Trifolium pratense]|uniref:Uncharacterized protein n=1 Tax=Trifolium pratense TaxID=57577 RepID=A0A2K3MM98_TRIPR|nr:hypothetical protein L195_g026955 [Trifolium pratense]PNX91908.1 hypothetical protein L195_g015033 [Trifolium pratense]